MRILNHIAYKFLTQDKEFYYEFALNMFPDLKEISLKEYSNLSSSEKEYLIRVEMFLELIGIENNTSYLITNTVVEKFKYLKIKELNWELFYSLKDCKKTFIFEGNRLLRFKVSKHHIEFAYLYKSDDIKTLINSKYDFKYHISFINKVDKRFSENFNNLSQEVQMFIYKFLCFFFFSKNTELILKPKEKNGTKKSGKIINDLNFPLIIVDSNWNITSIRNEEFTVSGHFGLRRCGLGHSDIRMVWIDTYEKKGYKRHAKNQENQDSNIII